MEGITNIDKVNEAINMLNDVAPDLYNLIVLNLNTNFEEMTDEEIENYVTLVRRVVDNFDDLKNKCNEMYEAYDELYGAYIELLKMDDE